MMMTSSTSSFFPTTNERYLSPIPVSNDDKSNELITIYEGDIEEQTPSSFITDEETIPSSIRKSADTTTIYPNDIHHIHPFAPPSAVSPAVVPDDNDEAPSTPRPTPTPSQPKQPKQQQQQQLVDAFNTSSVQCRLNLETWQNDNIDWWMKNPPYPLLDWVWELIDPETNQTYYKGYFHVLLCGGKGNCSRNRAEEILSFNWTWQDNLGDAHPMNTSKQMIISDVKNMPKILFRLDPPPRGQQPKQQEEDDNHPDHPSQRRIPTKLWPTLKNGTIPIIYDLKPYLKCDSIQRKNTNPPQTLFLSTTASSSKKKHKKHKKKPPKIGACITRFWGQHDLIPEWIIYHRMIGIEHFYLFVQEPFDNILHSKLPRFETDITYIPYNYTWRGHSTSQNKGDRSMITNVRGFTAGGEIWFQTAANNQCLNMAKQHGLDWIITPDVDEWIVIRDPTIQHFNTTTGSPLEQYFEKHVNQRNVTQVRLYGGGWGRHPLLEQNKTDYQLSLDFTYRKDRRWGNGEVLWDNGGGAGGRKKCFYNLQLVQDVGIHGHIDYGKSYGMGANTQQVELYHYRTPLLGPTESTPDQLVSYPEFRDLYKHKIVTELKKLNWEFPNFTKHVCKQYGCHQYL